MSEVKLLSTALITVAMLAAPALARENHMTSRHFTESADANTTIGVGHNDWRPCYGNRASEFCGYGDRDVWSHWGGYYGPMVHAP